MPPIYKLTLLLALFLALAAPRLGMAAATLLPNGEQCFSATTPTSGGVAGTGTGLIGALGTITAGTGGTAGTYPNITLTGSMSGQTSATANITVSGGGVTAVVILNPGTQYVVGDVLTATSSQIGNVSGFSVPINSVSINSSLAGGSVTFYIPNTNIFKQTWKNSTQTTLNTNPVTLDQNGCAIIYGTGTYRQVVQDSLGNTIWDQLTSDVSANNSTFWAGVAGGTPNAITVTDPGFNGTDGSIINFIPLANNTGPTTLNPSSYFGSPPSIVKDTTGGPVALVGVEINATSGGMPNVVSVIYSATYNEFHLLNTAIASASGATAPLCGASGLKMSNGASNSTVTITANSLVMVTSAGLTINRSSVSFTVNITLGTSTAAAGGMDGEALPASTAAWIDVFAIDNGSAPNGLGSLAAGNGQSPTLPSGYTYKCYLGAFNTNTSNSLLGEVVHGNRAQYVVGGANVSALPTLASGNTGTISTSSFSGTATSVSAVLPPTATRLQALMSEAAASSQSQALAPNNSYSGYQTTNPPPCWFGAVTNGFFNCQFELESTQVYYAGSSSTQLAQVLGWWDAVNAN